MRGQSIPDIVTIDSIVSFNDIFGQPLYVDAPGMRPGCEVSLSFPSLVFRRTDGALDVIFDSTASDWIWTREDNEIVFTHSGGGRLSLYMWGILLCLAAATHDDNPFRRVRNTDDWIRGKLFSMFPAVVSELGFRIDPVRNTDRA